MEDDGLGDDRPLDDERLRRLRVNCARLVELVDVQSGLLEEMMSVGCITEQQRQAVRELNSSSAEKNRKLLDILTRRSVAHYNEFLSCLRRNNQGFIANVLEHGGGQKQHLGLPIYFILLHDISEVNRRIQYSTENS